MSSGIDKQRVLLELRPETMRRAQRLARERHISVSELLAHQLEALIGPDDFYVQSERSAQELLERDSPATDRPARDRAA